MHRGVSLIEILLIVIIMSIIIKVLAEAGII